jgi:hypothetical protein
MGLGRSSPCHQARHCSAVLLTVLREVQRRYSAAEGLALREAQKRDFAAVQSLLGGQQTHVHRGAERPPW